MVRYKRIKYSTIAKMCIKVAQMKGEPVALSDIIDSMQRNMHIGVDRVRVATLLHDKIVEKVELVDDVAHVRVMVTP